MSKIKPDKKLPDMAESVNVAAMAEKLANSLFVEFHWRRTGPMNINWPCVKNDIHDVETHPADVVFYYDEPYENARTYIHCDLKSYGADSINLNTLRKAAISLSKQIACAEVSEEWQNNYQIDGHNSRVFGLLFIYNHDGDYDGKFNDHVWGLESDRLFLPPGGRLYVLGPGDLVWLESVRYELMSMRNVEGELRLPARASCRYLYPQLSRKRNVRPEIAIAATLEMLTSPWIVMEYDPDTGLHSRGIVIFYRRMAQSSDEFRYLLDYLRTYQLLEQHIIVQIKFAGDNLKAIGLFQKAQAEYAEELPDSPDSGLAAIINRVRPSMMDHVVSRFSQIKIGLDYERV